VKAQLRVRGQCPKCGRAVNTTAPSGRATWRGKCPRKDCDGQIIARRIPDERVADEPPADEPPAPPARRQPRKVVKASGYQGRSAGSTGGSDSGVRDTTTTGGGSAAPRSGRDGASGGAGPAPVQPPKASQHETGDSGRRHPYGHLFPGL